MAPNGLNKEFGLLNKNKDRSPSFIKLYDTIKFDLAHSNFAEAKSPILKNKNENSQDKENDMEYANV